MNLKVSSSRLTVPRKFEMVVIDELRDVASVSVGIPVTVVLQMTGGGTSFRVGYERSDGHGNPPPSMRGSD